MEISPEGPPGLLLAALASQGRHLLLYRSFSDTPGSAFLFIFPLPTTAASQMLRLKTRHIWSFLNYVGVPYPRSPELQVVEPPDKAVGTELRSSVRTAGTLNH